MRRFVARTDMAKSNLSALSGLFTQKTQRSFETPNGDSGELLLIESTDRVRYPFRKEKLWNEKPQTIIRRNYWIFFTSTSMAISIVGHFSIRSRASPSAG